MRATRQCSAVAGNKTSPFISNLLFLLPSAISWCSVETLLRMGSPLPFQSSCHRPSLLLRHLSLLCSAVLMFQNPEKINWNYDCSAQQNHVQFTNRSFGAAHLSSCRPRTT